MPPETKIFCLSCCNSVFNFYSGFAGRQGALQQCFHYGKHCLRLFQGECLQRLSSNLEHSVEGYAGPVFHVVAHFDLVDDAAFHQVLERPRKVLRRDAVHGRAEAAGVVQRDDPLAFCGELPAPGG